eukprot:4998762-Pleurochrysis_carterae.AAC.1
MSLTTSEGQSVRVKRLRPGDQFGYDAFLSEVHDTTVTCLTDVEVTAVPQHGARAWRQTCTRGRARRTRGGARRTRGRARRT